MTPSFIQAFTAGVIGLSLLIAVVRLSRLRRISFRYTMGWMVVAGIGIFGSVLVPLAAPIAGILDLSPAALLALVAFVFFLVITLQLSISISGLQQQNRLLAEELALLRHVIQSSSQSGE